MLEKFSFAESNLVDSSHWRARERSGDRSVALGYAGTLVVGLMVLVPVLDWIAASVLGTPSIYSVIVGIGVTGVVYAAILVRTRTFALSTVVALLVCSTVAANVPLAPTSGFENFMGNVGPQLWLLEVPLVALAGYLLVYARDTVTDTSLPEVLLCGFVLWATLSAVVSPLPKPSESLFYAVRMVVGFLSFAVATRAIRSGIVDFESAVLTFCVAVSGQAAFGVVQAVADRSFRLSVLGEAAITRLDPVVYTTLGVTNHVIPAGFTGHGYVLGTLAVALVPVTLVVALRARRRVRFALSAAAILMAFFVRLTASDSLRGGLLLALAATFVGVCLVILGRIDIGDRVDIGPVTVRERLGWIATTGVALLLAVLVPSARQSALAARAGGGGDGGSYTSPAAGTGHRFEQYAAGISAALDHPLFGLGVGNFKHVAGAEYGSAAIENMAVHNVYVGLLAETGLVGALLYAGAVAAVLYSGVRLVRANAENTLLAIGVLAGLLGVLGIAFWIHSPIDRINAFVPFWLLCGLVVGEHKRVERAESGTERRRNESSPTGSG